MNGEDLSGEVAKDIVRRDERTGKTNASVSNKCVDGTRVFSTASPRRETRRP